MVRYIRFVIKDNTVKVAILPKLFCRVNKLSIKIPAGLFVCLFVCFVEFHKLISKIYIEMQKTLDNQSVGILRSRQQDWI